MQNKYRYFNKFLDIYFYHTFLYISTHTWPLMICVLRMIYSWFKNAQHILKNTISSKNTISNRAIIILKFRIPFYSEWKFKYLCIFPFFYLTTYPTTRRSEFFFFHLHRWYLRDLLLLQSFTLIRLSKLLFICIALAFNLQRKSRAAPPATDPSVYYINIYIYIEEGMAVGSPTPPAIEKQNQQVARIFQHAAAKRTERNINKNAICCDCARNRVCGDWGAGSWGPRVFRSENLW